MRAPALVIAVLALTLSTTLACSSVTDGTGHAAVASQPRSGFPGSGTPGSGGATVPGGTGAPTSGTTTPNSLVCPHVQYNSAHLDFDCLDPGMKVAYNEDPFPIAMQKQVETAGWFVEEFAADYGSPKGKTLAQITAQVRSDMVTAEDYGTKPTIKTLGSASTKVAGVPASILQSSFTINPAYRTQLKLKVKVEKSWIVVLQASPDDVKIWVATVPDDVSALWAKVPAIIKTIHLT